MFGGEFELCTLTALTPTTSEEVVPEASVRFSLPRRRRHIVYSVFVRRVVFQGILHTFKGPKGNLTDDHLRVTLSRVCVIGSPMIPFDF